MTTDRDHAASADGPDWAMKSVMERKRLAMAAAFRGDCLSLEDEAAIIRRHAAEHLVAATAELRERLANYELKAAAMRTAMAGCSHCDYDESDGSLVDHCDACCRGTTRVAWERFSRESAQAAKEKR